MRLTILIITIICCIVRVRSLSCFKCITNEKNLVNDTCSDPFNPIDNRLENECQATVKGRNGYFPARFCVKISGIVVDVDRTVNRSLLHKKLYLRTCIIENIMDSTRSPDSTGNFRLKNFAGIKGMRMQGTITLCTLDGCNRAHVDKMNFITLFLALLLFVGFG